jgi:hypothetical protein
MCTICGCGNMGSAEMPRVIQPRHDNMAGEYGNFVLPGGRDNSGETIVPTPDRRMLGAGSSVGPDGRVAHAGAAGAVPQEDTPWGWGYDPAMSDEPVEQELTRLPMIPSGYTVRQQDAGRRDVGLELLRGEGVRLGVAPAQDTSGDSRPVGYVGYAPAPFAGACPLTGALMPETEAITGAGVGTLQTVQSRY